MSLERTQVELVEAIRGGLANEGDGLYSHQGIPTTLGKPQLGHRPHLAVLGPHN